MDEVVAPWTPEQVRELNRFQRFAHYHPFTCGNDSSHEVLHATTAGWVCLDCEYTQNWAHAFMAVNTDLI